MLQLDFTPYKGGLVIEDNGEVRRESTGKCCLYYIFQRGMNFNMLQSSGCEEG